MPISRYPLASSATPPHQTDPRAGTRHTGPTLRRTAVGLTALAALALAPAVPALASPLGGGTTAFAGTARPDGARTATVTRADATMVTAALHVATTGSDKATGTSSAPLRTVQAAVDKAVPGTTILVHGGTYTGQVKIRTSGTVDRPITLTSAGDGAVTLTADLPVESCAATAPAIQRTIMMGGGVDYWTVKGLNVDGGIHVFGKGNNSAYGWHAGLVKAKNYTERRKAPGRGVNDPVAAQRIVSYLATVTGDSTLDPSVGLQFTDNTITGQGIHAAFAREGVIARNTVTDIDCGTGPGIWLITFADGWQVYDNDVSRVKASTTSHYMQEGIRLGTASNYNRVYNNVVHDLDGDGRAFSTDVDSSYNEFTYNTARNVAIAFNEQMSGWGNLWANNTAENYRNYGYGFRLMDASLTKPSLDTSSVDPIVRCNLATTTVTMARALGVGGLKGGNFDDNDMSSAWLSKNVRSYWSSTGSTWNDSSIAPKTPMSISSGARTCAGA